MIGGGRVNGLADSTWDDNIMEKGARGDIIIWWLDWQIRWATFRGSMEREYRI